MNELNYHQNLSLTKRGSSSKMLISLLAVFEIIYT